MKVRALRQLRETAHMPTLMAGLLHFEVSFAVWVLLGVLAPAIRTDIAVPAAAKGLVVGVPFASACLCRIVVGYLSDRIGPRRVGTVTMVFVAVPLFYGAMFTDTLGELIAVSAMLGLAGASFAVALPLAAGSVPPEQRGLALGIAGAGNSGTVLAGLFAPALASVLGWRGVLGGAGAIVLFTAVAFRTLARETPRQEPIPFVASVRAIGGVDLMRLAGLYLTTFGTYVGLAAFLPTIFVDRYGASPVLAGMLAAVAAGLGSVTRPIGGGFADRVGGTRVVSTVLVAAAVLLAVCATAGSLLVAAVACAALLAVLGAGNGAVFQVVGVRFGDRVGTATGLVGAAGGLGGFLVPTMMGAIAARTGSYAAGFGLAAFWALAMLAAVVRIRVDWALAPTTHNEVVDAA